MGQHLQSSESVSVDGLGTFRMVMVARGKGVETSDEVSAAQATLCLLYTSVRTGEDIDAQYIRLRRGGPRQRRQHVPYIEIGRHYRIQGNQQFR